MIAELGTRAAPGSVCGAIGQRPRDDEGVADAVVFLASHESSDIHGATLSVDGGFTAR